MKKNTVRAAAGLLSALLIIFSVDIRALADRETAGSWSGKTGETETVSTKSGEENPSKEPEGETFGETEGQRERETETKKASSQTEAEMIKADMGAVEVTLTAGIEIQAEQTFHVLLKGRKGTERGELILSPQEGERAYSARLRFSKLAGGTYQLAVAGDGYITYIQDIEVGQTGCRVSLYTGRTIGFPEEARPGFLVYGDVNEDGQLNEEDSAAIAEAMETGQPGGNCDLNRDGVTDLLDLNYFTEFTENYPWQQSAVETFIPKEAVLCDTPEGTTVREGSLDSLFDEGGSVTLASASQEAVSEKNPLKVEFDFSRTLRTVTVEEIRMTSSRSGKKGISKGVMEVTYINGGKVRTGRFLISRTADGGLCVSLGGALEVKKAILWITGADGSESSQAELMSIDFIDSRKSRIPEPEPKVPSGIALTAGGTFFTAGWESVPDVTGYEVKVSLGELEEIYKTGDNRMEIDSLNKEALEEDGVYAVQVRSVNGAWKSAYSQPVSISMKPGRVPDAPYGLWAEAGTGSLTAGWKEEEEADTYRLFYRKAGSENWEEIADINGTEYEIRDLQEDTRYQVYVTACGSLGESPPSLTAAARTLSGPKKTTLPGFHLINLSDGEGKLSRHIRAAWIEGGVMKDSPLDQEENSGLGLFDNSASSYAMCESKDFGGNTLEQEAGVTVQLDQVYEVGMIALARPWDGEPFTYVSVQYWDGQNQKHRAANVRITEQEGKDGKYALILMDTVRASKLQIGVGREEKSSDCVAISEIRLYASDSIEKEIMALFADGLHTALKNDVSGEDIQELRQRLDREDPVSGSLYPRRELLQKELDGAQALLNGESAGGVTEINPAISAENDREIQADRLSDWQPLGVTAAAGETLTVYVSHPDMEEGETAALQLAVSQHHGDAETGDRMLALKTGRNEITVPRLSSTEKEKGGALYVRYTGRSGTDLYRVRVSGGSRYPVLNICRVSDEEREGRIRSYVWELSSYAAGLEERHEKEHGEEGLESVRYAYDKADCILNTTDILTDHMLISIPAGQALEGLGNSGQEERLSEALRSIDEMTVLFYQHRGLAGSFATGTDKAVTEKNHLPVRYPHIRYMEIPSGVFMYEGENHIGIGWNEAGSLLSGGTLKAGTDGRYESGRYFGRGLAHEIGHGILPSKEAGNEAAAGYFAILSQASGQNDSTGLRYDDVFSRVTSGAGWGAEDPLTQTAMYWQLHLAYDGDYTYKYYRNYQEICDNLFYARVGSYARDPASVPSGIAPELSGDREQVFMRLAASAAQRDLTDFFQRWGLMPDETTKDLMEQYAPEERAIYYLDDEARVYAMEHGEDGMAAVQETAVEIVVSGQDVTLTISPVSGSLDGGLQGYEITRVFVERGQERKEIAGFTRENVFIDHLADVSGRRTVAYEVTAIDRWMNRSSVFRTETVRPEGDGLLDQSFWTVETNMISPADSKPAAGQENPCGSSTISAAGMAADGRQDTIFTGMANGGDPWIVLKLKRNMPVSALRYTMSGRDTAASKYRIEISMDGVRYTPAGEGSFSLEKERETIYFEKSGQPVAYDAVYVKLTAEGQRGKEISFPELELYGLAGGSVDFQPAREDALRAGILSETCVYGPGPEDQIPVGSAVLIGTWQGIDPAGGKLILYDEDGDIAGGIREDGELRAKQAFLSAAVPEGAVKKGIWLYWLEPGLAPLSLPKKVRAELYLTEEREDGEKLRLISDTLPAGLPDKLPSVKLAQ